MSRHINKAELISKVRELAGLTNEEKSALLELLNEKKTYGLVWENHEEAVEEQLREQLPVLREVPERRIISEDADAPNHIIIEAENLHALVALTYTHAGMINVMYLDPPYNTGHNDFSYNDTFVDSEDNYRHSKWLSFMERRLKLAKALLTDKGMIFISIDDNEDAQLKLLCDEVFGNKNKVADIIWQSRKSVSNDTFVSQNHNYTLVYAKNLILWDKTEFKLPSSNEGFENRDNDPRGPWVADPFDAPEVRQNLTYPITHPNTGEVFYPPKGRHWRTTEEQYKEYLADNRIVFGKRGTSKPQLKRFLDFALAKGDTPTSIWNDIETTTNGTQLLQSIFGGEKVFTNPKPIELVKRILILMGKKDLTILDFFAGSGTTMHATMQLNAEDGGHRQCILVTNNENGICEQVTYERNKRVIQGYTTPKGEQVAGLTKNNLRYYKADFISRDPSSKNKRELVKAATDLLCIKENMYQETKMVYNGKTLRKDYARRFVEGDKEMIIIYEPAVIKYIVNELKAWGKKEFIKVYVFSEGRYAYDDDFKEVLDKVTLCALPDAIYQAYRRVLPRREKAESVAIDLSEEEKTEALADAAQYSYKEEKGGEA